MKHKFKSALETWFKKTVIEEKGTRNMLMLLFFAPFAFLFKLGSAFFHFLYDKKWLKQENVEPAICSVGNIVLGGVGKTPVVIMLAKALEEKIALAIISRGYSSSLEKAKAPFLLSKDKGPVISANHAGDEPYLIASKLSKTIVVVGKDRINSAKLCKQYGSELIILDDGMQHRKLKRDFEIVVLDGQNLFGNGHHFPCGLLREHPKGLSRASLLIINHISDEQDLKIIEEKLRVYSKAPMVFTRYVTNAPYDLLSSYAVALDNAKVALFAAIGNPFRFKSMIENKGSEVVQTCFLHDHAPISRKTLDLFALKSKNLGASMIIVTEKDAVKINKNWQLALPIAVAPISIEIIEGQEIWNESLNHLTNLALKNRSIF